MADASGEKNDASYDRLLWLIDYRWATLQERRLKRDEFVNVFVRSVDSSQTDKAAFDRFVQDLFEEALTQDLRSALFNAYAKKKTVRVEGEKSGVPADVESVSMIARG